MRKSILFSIATMALMLLTACTGDDSATSANNNNNLKQTKSMATIHLSTQDFKDKVFNYDANPGVFKYEGTKPAIVDFYATWCGPCKMLGPVLEELAGEYADQLVIYKVDVDEAQEVAQVFGIRSVPTLLFIPTDGKEPSMSAGAPTKDQLKQIIEDLIKK